MSDFLKFLGGLVFLGLIHEAMSKFSRIKASCEHGGSKASLKLERLDETQETAPSKTEQSVEENDEQTLPTEK